MADCIFCKIGEGQVPSYKVYEDESVLAFLDIHPCADGHTVVIPKKHFGEIGDVKDNEWQDLMRGLKIAIQKVDEVLKPAGMNVGINNRKGAGQAVPHLHWHIIPRYEGDGGGSMHSIIRNRQIFEVEEVAKRF
ncbi:MAG: HIT family protein [Patescibacteria group bacterium]|jgi:histidine triad (HIT) family protein